MVTVQTIQLELRIEKIALMIVPKENMITFGVTPELLRGITVLQAAFSDILRKEEINKVELMYKFPLTCLFTNINTFHKLLYCIYFYPFISSTFSLM